MNAQKLSGPEQDAIFAGLRLLAREMDAGNVSPNDGDVGEILTNAGAHDGLTADAVSGLCDRLLGGAA